MQCNQESVLHLLKTNKFSHISCIWEIMSGGVEGGVFCLMLLIKSEGLLSLFFLDFCSLSAAFTQLSWQQAEVWTWSWRLIKKQKKNIKEKQKMFSSIRKSPESLRLTNNATEVVTVYPKFCRWMKPTDPDILLSPVWNDCLSLPLCLLSLSRFLPTKWPKQLD